MYWSVLSLILFTILESDMLIHANCIFKPIEEWSMSKNEEWWIQTWVSQRAMTLKLRPTALPQLTWHACTLNSVSLTGLLTHDIIAIVKITRLSNKGPFRRAYHKYIVSETVELLTSKASTAGPAYQPCACNNSSIHCAYVCHYAIISQIASFTCHPLPKTATCTLHHWNQLVWLSPTKLDEEAYLAFESAKIYVKHVVQHSSSHCHVASVYFHIRA